MKPPDAQRERMVRLYFKRGGQIVSMVVLGSLFLLVAELVVLGSLFWIRTDMQGLLPSNSDEAKIVFQQLDTANARLSAVVAHARPSVYWSNRLLEVLEVMPVGVRVVRVSVESSRPALVVKASATSKALVVDFQKELEGLAWVDRVESPLQNFALSTDDTFSFTLLSKGI